MTLLTWIAASTALAQVPAFPGAEGFGAHLTGGRDGDVHRVTTLADSGVGSLQWALDQPGPRIVVFAVSGVIEGDVRIPHGDLTLAGESAPGAGITIRGHLYSDYGTTFGNLIIRHIRVRPPGPDAEWAPANHDGIQFSRNVGIILDHVDVSHGVDENIDLWGGAQDITIQWSAITWPVYGGGHPDGDQHNYGIINGPGGGRISLHHNLFAHNKTRTPALAEGPADVRNNVVYNGREGFVHHNPANGDFNIIGNTYIQGESADLSPFWFDPENNSPPTRYYMADNEIEDPDDFSGNVDNPWTAPQGFLDAYTISCCGIDSSQFNGVGEFDWSTDPGYVAIATESSGDAYDRVLDCAGAWPRDVALTQAVDDTRNRAGQYGNYDPGDWMSGLTAEAPYLDEDGDGMFDDWELMVGLDPADPTDHLADMGGYNAIEAYLHTLAAGLDPCAADYEPPGTGPTDTDDPTDQPTGDDDDDDDGVGDLGADDTESSGGGCGCITSPGPGSLWVGILGMLILVRVRRRRVR